MKERAVKWGKSQPWRSGNLCGVLIPYLHADYRNLPGRYQVLVYMGIPNTHGHSCVQRSFYTSNAELFESWLREATFLTTPGYRAGLEIEAGKLLFAPVEMGREPESMAMPWERRERGELLTVDES